MSAPRISTQIPYRVRPVPVNPDRMRAHLQVEFATIQRALPNTRVVSIDENYTADPRDRLILVDAAAAAVTVTLFSATETLANPLTIVKVDASAHAVHAIPIAGQTIGLATTDLAWTVQEETYTLHPDGASRWYIL